MAGEFVVSQRFQGSGPWIVHLPGGNRPHKIALFDSESEADEVASRINVYVQEEREQFQNALRKYGHHLPFCGFGHCIANPCTCGLDQLIKGESL